MDIQNLIPGFDPDDPIASTRAWLRTMADVLGAPALATVDPNRLLPVLMDLWGQHGRPRRLASVTLYGPPTVRPGGATRGVVLAVQVQGYDPVPLGDGDLILDVHGTVPEVLDGLAALCEVGDLDRAAELLDKGHDTDRGRLVYHLTAVLSERLGKVATIRRAVRRDGAHVVTEVVHRSTYRAMELDLAGAPFANLERQPAELWTAPAERWPGQGAYLPPQCGHPTPDGHNVEPGSCQRLRGHQGAHLDEYNNRWSGDVCGARCPDPLAEEAGIPKGSVCEASPGHDGDHEVGGLRWSRGPGVDVPF